MSSTQNLPSATVVDLLYPLHDPPNPLQCQLCGTVANRDWDLGRHIKIHYPNTAIYVCPYEHCEFRTRQKSNLEDHKNNIHLGIILLCQLCGRGCKSRSALSRHKKTHGHKPAPRKQQYRAIHTALAKSASNTKAAGKTAVPHKRRTRSTYSAITTTVLPSTLPQNPQCEGNSSVDVAPTQPHLQSMAELAAEPIPGKADGQGLLPVRLPPIRELLVIADTFQSQSVYENDSTVIHRGVPAGNISPITSAVERARLHLPRRSDLFAMPNFAPSSQGRFMAWVNPDAMGPHGAASSQWSDSLCTYPVRVSYPESNERSSWYSAGRSRCYMF